jgi:transcription termination/antitermination protein NusA
LVEKTLIKPEPEVVEEALPVIMPETSAVVSTTEEITGIEDKETPIQVELIEPVSAELGSQTVQAAPEPSELTAELEPIEAEKVEESSAAEEPSPAKAEEELSEESPASFNELFAARPEMLDVVDTGDEEEDDDSKKGKKKKKKSKHVEVEYDPDRDVVMVKKKHKRGSDWGNW